MICLMSSSVCQVLQQGEQPYSFSTLLGTYIYINYDVAELFAKTTYHDGRSNVYVDGFHLFKV